MKNKTRQVQVGHIYIGGGAPVTVQSMTNTLTSDFEKTLAQIKRLEDAGCDIIRVSIPDEQSVGLIGFAKSLIRVPLVADIHFDYKLALKSIAAGIDKLRINPGNIGARWKVAEIVAAAKEYNIPIRVGVNAGSLEKKYLDRHGHPTAKGIVDSALEAVNILASENFDDIVMSLKSSDVRETVEANRLFAQASDYPLHLGVTESGFGYFGITKSAVGIGALLLEGIGDTIRISLSDDPVEEVKVGRYLLKSLGLRKEELEIISCPTCARQTFEVKQLAERVVEEYGHLRRDIKIAIMGCVVNGPGEARVADIGVTAGDKEGVIFKKGEIVQKVPLDKLADTFIAEIAASLKEQ